MFPPPETAADDPSGNALAQAAQRAFEFAHLEAIAQSEPTGCMLTVCALNRTRNEVTTCQVGVAAACLFARGRNHEQPLTEDHRLATSASEQRRLQEMGVSLAPGLDANGAPSGPLRAWPGGLTCARALGNLGPAAFPAVSPVPSCSIVTVPPSGGDLFIGSYGVWGELLGSQIASLARASPSADTATRLIVESAAAQHTSYYQDGYGIPLDDATCVILRIGMVKKQRNSREKLLNAAAATVRPSNFSRWIGLKKTNKQPTHAPTPTFSMTPGSSTPSVLTADGSVPTTANNSPVLRPHEPSMSDSSMLTEVDESLLNRGLQLEDGSELRINRLVGVRILRPPHSPPCSLT